MNKKLILIPYLKRNNLACMVFKKNGLLYRINNLKDVLQFVASMEEINKELETRKLNSQELTLVDKRNQRWWLHYIFNDTDAVLRLTKERNKGELTTVFKWNGTVAEFKLAVKRMSDLVHHRN